MRTKPKGTVHRGSSTELVLDVCETYDCWMTMRVIIGRVQLIGEFSDDTINRAVWRLTSQGKLQSRYAGGGHHIREFRFRHAD